MPMAPVSIFYPVFVLVLLTMMVWLMMLVRRAVYMQRHGILPSDMPSRALADQHFGVAQAPNNNLMNLFEIPVLFYLVIVMLFLLGMSDRGYLMMSWSFVVFRCLQSLVHLTYNNVLHRGIFYLVSSGVLWLMWLRLIYQVLVTGTAE